MKKKTVALALLGLLGLSLSACGSKNYADGTYTGTSGVYQNDDGSEEGNGYGVVTITIKDNQITECSYLTYETDGTLKDAEYGKEGGEIKNRDYYNKAQKAVGACDKYAESLIYTQDVRDVDTISGATINHDEFTEAVKDALSQAEVK